MAIRNLELRARVVVEGFWTGLHRSPYHGFSVEFTEYRPYTPGDDTRYLDWRLLARSDRYYLKRFEDETNLRCHLLVDHSRSMSYGSIGFSKSDYARTLAATLAWFLNAQGDAVGLFSFAENIRDYLPARHRHGHLRQIMLALEKDSAGRETDLAEPLRRVAEIVRKRGLIVLISDLLAPTAELDTTSAGSPPPGTRSWFSRCWIPTKWRLTSVGRRCLKMSKAANLYISTRRPCGRNTSDGCETTPTACKTSAANSASRSGAWSRTSRWNWPYLNF